MRNKIIMILLCIIGSIQVLFSQVKVVEIVVPPNDSVYVWKGNGGDQHWYGFYTDDNSLVISSNDSTRTINQIHTMCGRGNCPGGIEMNFYNNGMMESKGQYGFTTDVDSLKYTGSDGFYFNIDKVGDWYYWDAKGYLIRKEKWVKGKLVATTRFSTTVLPARKPRRKK